MFFYEINDVIDHDFYEIYEENGQKRIRFSGYIYTNGEPGYDIAGQLDDTLSYRIVEYANGLDFSLQDYLENDQLFEDAYERRKNDYIKDSSKEEALYIANNWFGNNVSFTRTNLTMSTPVGYYVQ